MLSKSFLGILFLYLPVPTALVPIPNILAHSFLSFTFLDHIISDNCSGEDMLKGLSPIICFIILLFCADLKVLSFS